MEQRRMDYHLHTVHSFDGEQSMDELCADMVSKGVQEICKDLKADKFAAGLHTYSLTDGGVDIAPTQTLLTPEALAAVEQAKKDILDGKIVVPTTLDACPAFTLAN